MAKQFLSDETIFYITTIDASEEYGKAVATADAVISFVGSSTDEVISYVDSSVDAPKESIKLTANNKTYEVTIDANGELAVAEVVAEPGA